MVQPVLSSRAAAPHPVELADAEADRVVDLLHDGPVQSLAFAHFAAEAAVRGGDAVAARNAVQAALVELRRLLWHLRPRGVASLAPALTQLSDRLVEAGRAPLVLDLDQECAAALDPATESTVYRLVQAAALSSPTREPLRAVLERDGAHLVLGLAGDGLDLEPWAGRVRTVGGQVTATADGYRVLLPAPPPRPEAIS